MIDEIVANLIIDELIFEEGINYLFLYRSGQLKLDKETKLVQSINSIETIKSNVLNLIIKYIINFKSCFISDFNNYFRDRTRKSQVVVCPVCLQEVAGQRFAPHLEKCLRGGQRGSKRTESKEIIIESSSIKRKRIHVDPYPNSLIVRIKLRNGGKII
jgi:hypothetical protein